MTRQHHPGWGGLPGVAEDRGQDAVVIHVCDEQETDGRVRTKKIQKCKVIAERTQWQYHTRMSAAEET